MHLISERAFSFLAYELIFPGPGTTYDTILEHEDKVI